VLPALPALLLLAGMGASSLVRYGRLGRVLLGVLVLWLVAGVVRITPDQLAYFNELAGGPDGGDAVLLDSNLDWGQDEGALTRFAASHFVVINPRRPVQGLVAANVQALHDLNTDWSAPLRWLRRLPVESSIGHTIRIYRVDEGAMRAAAGADPVGPVDLAAWLTATGRPGAALEVLAGPPPSGAVGLAWSQARVEAFLALGRVDDAAALASTAGDHDLVTYIEHLRLESQGVPWSQRPDWYRHAIFDVLLKRELTVESEELAIQVLRQTATPDGGAGDMDAGLALLRVRVRRARPSADPRRHPPDLLAGLPPIKTRSFTLLSARPADLPFEDRAARCLLLTKLGNEALAMSELGTLLIDDPSNQGVAFQYGILVVNRKYQPGGYEWPDVVWRSR
jgi:hypothetical protein